MIGGCDDRDILWAFFTNLSLESIYLSPELRKKWPYFQNYRSILFLTRFIILLIFLLFSQIEIGVGTLCPPPPIITKVHLPLIITKVKGSRKNKTKFSGPATRRGGGGRDWLIIKKEHFLKL